MSFSLFRSALSPRSSRRNAFFFQSTAGECATDNLPICTDLGESESPYGEIAYDLDLADEDPDTPTPKSATSPQAGAQTSGAEGGTSPTAKVKSPSARTP